jgi:hypothetical protein
MFGTSTPRLSRIIIAASLASRRQCDRDQEYRGGSTTAVGGLNVEMDVITNFVGWCSHYLAAVVEGVAERVISESVTVTVADTEARAVAGGQPAQARMDDGRGDARTAS